MLEIFKDSSQEKSPIKVLVEPCSPVESESTDIQQQIEQEHQKSKKHKPLLKAYSVHKPSSYDYSSTGLSGPLGVAFKSYLNRTRSVSLKQDSKNRIEMDCNQSNIELIKKHSVNHQTSNPNLLNHVKLNHSQNICNKKISNNNDAECECDLCTMQNQLNNEDQNEPKATYSYLKSYFVSMLQPSDNKLAMKLFGSKKGVLKEKLRQQEVGHWIIHPCSNFR